MIRVKMFNDHCCVEGPDKKLERFIAANHISREQIISVSYSTCATKIKVFREVLFIYEDNDSI